jgi:hypothetical protein
VATSGDVSIQIPENPKVPEPKALYKSREGSYEVAMAIKVLARLNIAQHNIYLFKDSEVNGGAVLFHVEDLNDPSAHGVLLDTPAEGGD